MGKGFNNYMTKKFFHPASKDNIKRVWMAQQKTSYDKKKQEELMNQYQKEQEMLSNRALLGDEKAKLGLSFLYDAPPGLRKKEKEDEGEQEIKFEWQRKYNAPREAYAKNDETIRDQPFGIEVRNVRCIKCRQWGHVNTDKICPLFGRNLTAEPPQPENTTASLLEGLKEDGFQMKKSIMGRLMEGEDETRVDDSDKEEDPEVQFLKSLTPKQKKKLLKKLNRLQAKGSSMKAKKSKKEKKKRKKSRKVDSDSSDSERKSKKKKSKSKRAKTPESSSENSSSEDSEEEARGPYLAKNRDVRAKDRQSTSSRRQPSPSHRRRSRSPLARSSHEQLSRGSAEETRSRRDSGGGQQAAYRDRRHGGSFQNRDSDSDDDRSRQRKANRGGKQDSRDKRRQVSSSDDDRSRERKSNSKMKIRQRPRSISSPDSAEEKYKPPKQDYGDRRSKQDHRRKQESSSSSDSEDERMESRRKGESSDRARDRYSDSRHDSYRKSSNDKHSASRDYDRGRREEPRRDGRRDEREERPERKDGYRNRDRH